ncbi:MAG: nucleotidyl transferase AbiEii/AbiGii toxin family protein [Candidatus Limnocylindrales bacterium]
MKNKTIKNVAASVRERLYHLSQKRDEDFQLMLTRYGLERLLYRLGRSKYRDRFVLKGAMLFSLWGEEMYRATRDVDFLGFGDSSTQEMTKVFRDLCAVSVEDDGLVFKAESVVSEEIRNVVEYGGVRVTLEAGLERARIPIQADIGFGDVVTPAAEEIEYPSLLNALGPKIRAYPKETVIAEKYEAVVRLGIANSRMKDFYDLWAMARNCDFDGKKLSDAIRATFERRRTALMKAVPTAFTPEFYEDKTKLTQWRAFLNKRLAAVEEIPLSDVAKGLRDFLLPPTEALLSGSVFKLRWDHARVWTG